MRAVKLEDRRTGYLGEGCYRSRGRRFIKRLEHRHNRRYAKRLVLLLLVVGLQGCGWQMVKGDTNANVRPFFVPCEKQGCQFR